MKKVIMHRVKDSPSCSRYEVADIQTARGENRQAVSTLFLNTTFGKPMPDIIEVTIVAGVAPPPPRKRTNE